MSKMTLGILESKEITKTSGGEMKVQEEIYFYRERTSK